MTTTTTTQDITAEYLDTAKYLQQAVKQCEQDFLDFSILAGDARVNPFHAEYKKAQGKYTAICPVLFHRCIFLDNPEVNAKVHLHGMTSADLLDYGFHADCTDGDIYAAAELLDTDTLDQNISMFGTTEYLLNLRDILQSNK